MKTLSQVFQCTSQKLWSFVRFNYVGGVLWFVSRNSFKIIESQDIIQIFGVFMVKKEHLPQRTLLANTSHCGNMPYKTLLWGGHFYSALYRAPQLFWLRFKCANRRPIAGYFLCFAHRFQKSSLSVAFCNSFSSCLKKIVHRNLNHSLSMRQIICNVVCYFCSG